MTATTAPSGRVTPRPAQQVVLDDLTATAALHDRVQLLLACGFGKTLIARWHAAAAGADTVVVFLPSLALVAQTLREWRRPADWDFQALIVCSDPTTSHDPDRAGEDAATAVPGRTWSSTRAAVTTDPAAVARVMTNRDPGRPLVVFSTYHSAPAVAEAQHRTGLVFDLAVCDEAHRLAGAPRIEFRAALDSRAVIARRRLFLTATAREESSGISMDDPRLFGPVAHSYSFGDAITAGLLCDYQVLVIGTRTEPHPDPSDNPGTDPARPAEGTGAGLPAALLAAIDQHQLRRVLTFHARVRGAAEFADLLDGAHSPGGAFLRARHVSAAVPVADRTDALTWLADPTSHQVRMIASARCLTEGIDVPAVDAVLFADPRSSVIDIIQAVGRVLRPAPGKRRGTIIVPVALPAEGDDDTELLVSAFAPLWTVLRGLRAHDGRFAAALDHAQREFHRTGRRHDRALHQVRFVLPPNVDDDAVRLRMVQEVGTAWESHFGALQSWADHTRGARLTRDTHHRSLHIGEWAHKQRQAYSRGVLPVDRARRLDTVPGWFWNAADATWEDTFDILAAIVRDRGTVTDNPGAPSVFADHHTAGNPRRRLGTWVAEQRQAHRLGTLDPRRAAHLESLPGWSWTPIPVEDLRMVDALAAYVAFERHADPPADHCEDGLPLGRWVWTVRRRKLVGTLHPALEDEILAATPSRDNRRAGRRWLWHTAETKWRLAYTALLRYADRTGAACPPVTHSEALPDTTVQVGQWVALQRHRHRRGQLDDTRTALLDALPGWKWNGELGATTFPDPIDLPPGIEHGSAGARAHGCGCVTCIEARRAYDRAWLARRRTIAGGVDATRSRDRLRELDAAGAGRRLVSLATGIPLGTLRTIAVGATPQVHPDHEHLLLNVTTEMCLSHANRTNLRGQPRTRASERIDAAPTIALLKSLADRGFSTGWVARELGGQRTLTVRGPLVTRHLAERIADLAAQIGDRTMPVLRPSQPRPTLKTLLREEHHAA